MKKQYPIYRRVKSKQPSASPFIALGFVSAFVIYSVAHLEPERSEFNRFVDKVEAEYKPAKPVVLFKEVLKQKTYTDKERAVIIADIWGIKDLDNAHKIFTARGD